MPGCEEEIPIPSGFKEQASAINYMKRTYNLKKLVITGNICVGRAVTLQDPNLELVFDFAIYHEDIASTGDQLYQLDRTKGHIKKSGKIPLLICTKKVANELFLAEKCAFVGENSNVKSLFEHVKNVKNEHTKESDWKLLTQGEFTSRELANKFLVENKCRRNNKETKNGDFIMSSATGKLDILSYDIVKLKLLNIKTPTALFSIGNDEKIGNRYGRMIICYHDLTDANSICFIVRIIEKVK
jgi:hypothetical protein